MNNLLQLFNEHSRNLATAASIVLIVLISLSVANTVLFVMEIANPPTTIDTNQGTSTKATPMARLKVSNLELFGKFESIDNVPENVDAPETKLNLELQGVFIADDSSRSTAIVGEKNKAGELYVIGDKLPGNATLAAVFEDHVLLRRGGRMEKLLFSDSKYRVATAEPTQQSPSNQNGRTGSASANRSRLEQLRNRLRNEPRAQNNAASSNTRTALENYKLKLQSDPAGALSSAGVLPVEDGASRGYKIGADADAAIKQAGLQSGDVILSVNGKPVGVATSDAALMNQVMASSRVRVEVQRGTRRFFLTVPVPK